MEIGNRAFSQIYREYKPGVLGAGSSEHLRSNLQGTKLYTHSAFSISGFSEEATKARQGKWAAGAAYVKGAIDQQFGEGVGAQLFKKISDNVGRDLNKELLRSDLKAIDANIDKIMGENFLDGVKDRFGALNENDHPPAWHSPDLLCAVEAHVWDQVKRGRSLEGAISGLREALAADETLHPGLKAKIGAALDATVEEVKLHAELRKHDAFMGISQENMWKLFAGGEMQAQGTSKWDLEHCGEGSLAGMQRAFRTMLEGLGTMGWSASKLTANDLERIHIEGSRGTFRSEGLVLSYKPGVSGPEDQAELRGESRVPEGFRNSDTDLNMRHKQTTKAGREEVERLVEQDPLWFTGVEERLYPDRPQDNAFHLQHAKRSPEECRERTEAILKTYNKEIGKAKTEDDKLLAIAKAVQDLYRSHVFMDGNTRTVVFTLMNRMLLENGLGPAILPEPKAAAGFSREEFANQIRDGQFLFLTKA